jgi:hypothetical protein
MTISDEEAAARSFILMFRFPEHNFKGKTLGQVWDEDPRLLLDIARWKKLAARWPQTHEACQRLLRCERIAALVVEIDKQTREHFKDRARERKRDRELQDRQTEWGWK